MLGFPPRHPFPPIQGLYEICNPYSSPKTHKSSASVRTPWLCGGENFCRPLEIWVLLKCHFHLQVGWNALG